MAKRLFFVLGVIIGIVVGEIFRRKKMERLHELETKQARQKAQYAEYEREWQEEVRTMPFDERLNYELWEAGMRLNNWTEEVDIWGDTDDEEAN